MLFRKQLNQLQSITGIHIGKDNIFFTFPFCRHYAGVTNVVASRA